MSRLLEVADLCSSTVSDPANRLRKTRKKKSSAVPLFRSGRRSLVCARLGSKGKVGVQRGRKTAGCPSFLPTAVGTASSPPRVRRIPALRRAQPPAEVQRKTPRPSGANPPAAVRVPRSADAEKEPPVRGEPACGSSCAPVSRCRKGAARQGRTRLRQFACPAQPVQKRSRPSGANPPAAVRLPWSPCAEKRKAPQNCFRGAQSMHFYSNRSSVSTSLRAGACGSCAG